VSAIRDLLHDYQHVIGDVRLVMGSKGVFDVNVDGELLFSKHAEGRHAEPGEVLDRFRSKYATGVSVYER
jgi:selenoprotein W-related protein